MFLKASHIWAVVVLVGLALTAVVVLAVTDSGSTDLLTVIGSAVVPTITILLVGGRVQGDIAEVRREVNGRFSEAIAKIPDPENRPTVEG